LCVSGAGLNEKSGEKYRLARKWSVGELDSTRRLAQFKVESEPVKLGGLTKQFGVSATSMQIAVLNPNKLKEL